MQDTVDSYFFTSTNQSKQQSVNILLNCCVQGCSILQGRCSSVLGSWVALAQKKEQAEVENNLNTLTCTNLSDLQASAFHLKCLTHINSSSTALAYIPNYKTVQDCHCQEKIKLKQPPHSVTSVFSCPFLFPSGSRIANFELVSARSPFFCLSLADIHQTAHDQLALGRSWTQV